MKWTKRAKTRLKGIKKVFLDKKRLLLADFFAAFGGTLLPPFADNILAKKTFKHKIRHTVFDRLLLSHILILGPGRQQLNIQ